MTGDKLFAETRACTVKYGDPEGFVRPLPETLVFLDDQRRLVAGVIYLATEKAACTMLSRWEVTVSEGAMLIVSDASDVIPEALARYRRLTVIGVAETMGRLYNSLSIRLAARSGDAYILNDDDLFTALWNDIQIRRPLSFGEIFNRLKQFKNFRGPYVRMAVVDFDVNDIAQIPFRHAVARLHELIADCFITISSNEIVILMYSEQERFDGWLSEEVMTQISAFLGRYNGRMGVSHSTTNLVNLGCMAAIAKQTSFLGSRLSPVPDRRVYTSESFGTHLIVDMCCKYFYESTGMADLSNLIHPAVLKLHHYDKEKDDNLVKVLNCYLSNDRNLGKTGEKLYMHKNTVVNKLRKIRQLVDVDWDSSMTRQQLFISTLIVDYCMHIQGRSI